MTTNPFLKTACLLVFSLLVGAGASAQLQDQSKMNTHTSSGTIVFVHGLFMNPQSWNNWKQYFEEKGYTCIVPGYPHHTGTPSDLRNNIPEKLGTLTLTEVVDYYANIVQELPEKPILVGHSIGGLIVQILVNRDLALKGVAIDPAPPKGVFTLAWSFLKGNIATVNPLKGDSPFLPSVKWFQYAFCNTMTLVETQKIYEEFVVPESRNIPRESTKKAGTVDFKKAHAPLLIIAGEKDHITPASLNRKNARKYKNAAGVINFKEFQGRTHILCMQEGWEEIAAYVDEWITDTPTQSNFD